MTFWRLFDRFEDGVRRFLSRYPIFYSLLAGVGMVLFWRGVWHTTDSIGDIVWRNASWATTIDLNSSFWDGPVSLLLGTVILLGCGIFVSGLLGNEIIISGLRGEKKLTERTEVEVRTETGAVGDIRHQMRVIARRLEAIEKKIDGKVDSKH